MRFQFHLLQFEKQYYIAYKTLQKTNLDFMIAFGNTFNITSLLLVKKGEKIYYSIILNTQQHSLDKKHVEVFISRA